MLSIKKHSKILRSNYLRSITKDLSEHWKPHSLTATKNGSVCGKHNFHTISHRQKNIHSIRSELKAVSDLLHRSSPSLMIDPQRFANFHTNIAFYQKSDESKKPDKQSDNENPESSGNNSNNEKKGKKKKGEESEDKDMLTYFVKTIVWTAILYSAGVVVSMAFQSSTGAPPDVGEDTHNVSWQHFVYHMLGAGEVKRLIVRPDTNVVTIILHDGAIIKGRKSPYKYFHMFVADYIKFEEKLRDVEQKFGIKDSVPITYDRKTGMLTKLFITLVFVGVLIWMAGKMKGTIKFDSPFSKMTQAKYTLVNPLDGGRGVLFKDVAGLQEAKQEVMEFVDYLKNPQKYQSLGAKVPKGALLLGPPGCGKTLLAKAVATEAKVPFLSMNGSEFIEMIGGLGAARVRDLFKAARERAPCIIYIDELDAIGRQRSGTGRGEMSSGESEQTLNQLLVEMDGIASKQGVLMLASTNRGDVLDKALLRPGRFDRHILIDLPNLQERKEIFERHLSTIVLEYDPIKYSSRLAILTPGFSGADIANVCNEAALHAARSRQKKILAKDLEYAVERLVGGTEKRSHALSHEERRVVAYHESGHALVGWLLENSDVLQKVTIVPRTNLALGFAQYTPSEQKLFTKEQITDKICMTLGGRAAENITFAKITTGAQNDLDKVTKIAYAMVSKYGMSDRLGAMYVPDEPANSYTDEKPYSKALGNIIDDESRKIIQDAYKKTEQLLKDNRDKLIKLAEALLEKETLNYEQVVELIGEPKFDAAKRRIEPIEFDDSIKKLSNDTTQIM